MDPLSNIELHAAKDVVAAQPVSASTSPDRPWGPKKITHKMQQAIRMLTAGQSYDVISKELGYSKAYLKNFFTSAFGRQERERLQKVVEATYTDKIAAQAAGAEPRSGAAFEVQEAELEAITELRRLLMNSKSDQARAIAAKELLELSHLKQRLAVLAKPSGDETGDISEKDVQDFNRAVADLRDIALIGSSKPPAPNSDSASEPAQQETSEGVATSEADAPAVQHDKDGSQK